MLPTKHNTSIQLGLRSGAVDQHILVINNMLRAVKSCGHLVGFCECV